MLIITFGENPPVYTKSSTNTAQVNPNTTPYPAPQGMHILTYCIISI